MKTNSFNASQVLIYQTLKGINTVILQAEYIDYISTKLTQSQELMLEVDNNLIDFKQYIRYNQFEFDHS
jgi:hypothetical protein